MALTACGTSTNNNSSTSGGGSSNNMKNFKVGMVTDIGGVNDKSFNQSAWEGLQRFGKDMKLTQGTQYKYLQSTSSQDYETNLNALVHTNYNLVFGIGYLMADAIKDVATANPKAHLAIVDSAVDAKNVASISFKEEQGSFLVGVVAGLTTKTNKIGFVGGVQSALIKKFEDGFTAGVKTVNPNATVMSQYAGSFAAADKGQTIASSFYSQGADVIYTAAGQTGNGVFTEAKTRKKNGQNVWVIGVDRDQYDQGLPENVTLTSMVKRVDNAVYKVSQMEMNGKFPGGQTLEFGLKEDGVGLAPTTKNISNDVLTKEKDYEKQIISGKIKVPQTDKALTTYLASLK
ncbi:BMP family ABC transporter substrate-binding protein [Pullulanibacillus sp. KACC 23026]|uniref:BMP family lipoprotein n=1 Tax=Pullulanibacillus sp. KACC 23026 TaxID=3028315 RepID=UPI0023B06A8F|nr:BMP family ABC transporter substrate-binding protein [Pullulanibacillus sp. KACC 23026]WEG14990.1 BMP family ABC transporter substrate-binding protein [Pullulanibacillus sp. KACC 23026]